MYIHYFYLLASLDSKGDVVVSEFPCVGGSTVQCGTTVGGCISTTDVHQLSAHGETTQ